LFLLVLDGVLCRALDGKKTWRLKESLEDMEYADDVCLVSHRYEDMQRKLDDFWKESKKVGLDINPSKTEEIRVNTILNQVLRLNREGIKRSSDFSYFGCVVAEDSGASTDLNVRIQKVRGSFSKLRKAWLSTSIQKGTEISIFNACMKSVLVYGLKHGLLQVKFDMKHKLLLIDVLDTS
jgi:hypothetical protein